MSSINRLIYLKKLQHVVEYIVYLTIETFVAYLPEQVLIPFSKFLAWLGFKVFKFRHEVALNNLQIAFPEKNSLERFTIAYKSFQHFMLLAMEFMKLSRWTIDKVESMIEVDGKSEIIEYFQKNKSGILVSGHFGNWELAIALLSKKYVPFAGIQTEQRNKWINKKTVDLREKWGMKIIYKKGAVRESLKMLNQERWIAILGDQDGGKRGLFVPFFGKLASTPPGPALLKIKSKKPMIFAYCVRIAPFKYKGVVIPITFSEEQELKTDLLRVTTLFTQELENAIRKYPEQYLWIHRRWKTPYQKND